MMKGLRRTFGVTKIDLRSTFRNKSSLFFGFLFPLIFIFIFGSLGDGKVVYDVAIYTDTDKQNPVYETVTSLDILNVIEDKSDEEINDLLSKGEIDGALTFETTTDKGFPQYNVVLSTSAVNQEEGTVLSTIFKDLIEELNGEGSTQQKDIANLTVIEVTGREYTQIDFILPGQLAFALLSIGVIGTAFTIVSLRDTLVLKRFFATPLRKSETLIGFGMSKLLYAMLQATVLITAGVLLFDFTLVNGVPTFIQMLIFSMFGLIVFLGFGFIVSIVAKDESAVAPLSNIITLPQFLLAGTFFPVEFFPEWLQPISRILPLTYLNTALRKISFEGVAFTELGTEIAALLIWGFIVYFVAIRLFRWEKR